MVMEIQLSDLIVYTWYISRL